MPEDMSKDPRHSPIRTLAHVFLYCLGGTLAFYPVDCMLGITYPLYHRDDCLSSRNSIGWRHPSPSGSIYDQMEAQEYPRQSTDRQRISVCHKIPTSGHYSDVCLRFISLPHIPLALLYASLTKFFLLFLLSIWPPMRSAPSSLKVPPYLADYPLTLYGWNMFNDLILDREWLVRNLLGGMAAGFGLRGKISTVAWGPGLPKFA